MAYSLQNTSEEIAVASDLEHIVGGSESPRQLEASGRGRFFSLLAGAVLTVAALAILATRGGAAEAGEVAKPSSSIGLSEWQKILGDKAYAKMKAAEQLGEERPKMMTFDIARKASLRSTSPRAGVSVTVAPAPKPTELNASSTNLTALAKDMIAESQRYDSSSYERKAFQNIAQMLAASASARNKSSSTSSPSSEVASQSPLAPSESLEDGNKCPSDEEEYPKTGGTCFKTCSALTGGAYPIRTSAFSCCAQEPCRLGNSKVHLSFCGGFDVGGEAEGSGCPASEGACLQNEEMLDGICYKKCSLFDKGDVYFHRVAPNVCCSTKGFRCLLPQFTKFSADFAVGGGKGDGIAATPSLPHTPVKELTETTV